ncbi:MAG: cyclic pyranopterin monophosphate synthase MoaC [Desulfurivibrionaceae bacterium]|jgi:cyclic pyranopterin phosphate synthase|nr:cyclic pyranopterin monophosphate synthase MoaC [Pseudomonadota bacterium]MCG2824583.1 cyclic pyranopterin monophosphate synthase MoaC [Desulfobulbaceae bacterium]MDP2003086.1 cyclic pyranopterin monophosphate synthase MoaC [Desulfurivibrionaceae bacterium]PKN15786.1 MAG: cyclic pyranopterin monophosphate synthase MoaC [Deltaproteobacteria bacterium HGW-Deltaproteobacteria-3]MBU4228747.1 cyclic pyranopterin monophosphate synthase MoaC [Pseudomonadota bacterium]
MSDQPITDNQLTHFDESGNARMVDVGGKSETVREATASGAIALSAQAFQLVRDGNIAKGDVLGVARIAGIMAAKKVDALIPLAHPLAINKVTVDFDLDDRTHTIGITATVGITGRTGVEMEALTAVSVAALTIYDMCKAVDKGMIINNIRLERKIGGKSGSYQRKG